MDPGTALAVVSLGLSVCEWLKDVESGVRNSRKDVQDLLGRLEALKGFLAMFKNLWSLKTYQRTPELEEAAERVFARDGAALQRLYDKLRPFESFDTVDKETNLHKLKNVPKKLRYALGADEIKAVAKDANDLKTDLILLFNFSFFENDRHELKDGMQVVRNIEKNMFSKKDRDDELILDWTGSFSSPETIHEAIMGKSTVGTGKWIFSTQEWDHWYQRPSSILWLHGEGGCGKSVLCSSIIEHLNRHSTPDPLRISCAFFYFTFDDSQEQSLRVCLMSLLHQLCRNQTVLPPELQKAWQSARPNLPTLHTLERLLHIILAERTRTFLVFDALDECAEHETRKEFLTWLRGFHSLCLTNVSILITSRFEADISNSFSHRMNGVLILSLTASRNIEDIRCFVEFEIENDRKLKKLAERNPDLDKTIKETLIDQSAGMFRWAACQMRSLQILKWKTNATILETLQSLPKDLYETYDRILSKIEPKLQELALRVLIWLVYARRPLTLEEIAEVCIVNPYATENVIDKSMKLEDPEDFLELMPDLITWQKQKDHTTTVRLAHFSVQEFLLSLKILETSSRKFHLDPTSSNIFITQACLKYIFEGSKTWVRPVYGQQNDEWPLMKYSGDHWYDHYTEILPEFTQSENAVIYTLFTSPELFRTWLKIGLADDDVRETDSHKWGSPIYFAAYLGLSDCFEKLLSAGHDINAEGGRFGTPLQASAAKKRVKIFNRLLDLGADPHAQNGHYGNALAACAANDLDDCVTRLLDMQVNVQASHSVALHHAAEAGRNEMVRRLISAGASVNEEHPKKMTPLICAAFNNHCGIINTLVDAGAEPSQVLLDKIDGITMKTKACVTAVQVAADDGHLDALVLLIELGADVSTIGGSYHSALGRAAASDSHNAARILLDHGANPTRPVSGYPNPLHCAFSWGHLDMAILLIEAGVLFDGMDRAEMDREMEIAGGIIAWATKQLDQLYNGPR